MIVSLNGTIQKPNSSFTVSGSTITFASNLATGDVIDFIQILGDVLDLGVPSDATVTTAKLADNNVTTAKLAYNPNPNRNIIINGDMSIAQRATSASSLTSSGYHTVDRYQTSITNIGTWTQSQSTTVPTGQGFSTSLKMDCTTADASLAADDFLLIKQKIEGQNVQYLKKGTSSAESLTLSFWVRSNKTGTYITRLQDADNSRNISQSYTISSADTWEKKTLTFAGDSTGAFNNDNGSSLELNFWLGAGSTYTSGTLNTSWNSITDANIAVGQVNLADSTSNEWYVTGVQLEAGTSASDFEFLPFDVNLQRCQRYFTKISYGQLSSEDVIFGLTFGGDGSDNVMFTYRFPVDMRATPTITVGTTGGGAGTASTQYIDPEGMQLYYTGADTSQCWLKSVTAGSEL
jgi:hypothetical protein